MSNNETRRPTNEKPTLEQVLGRMPTPGFQRHLREQLMAQMERTLNMTTTQLETRSNMTTAKIPTGFRNITPYLLVKDVDRMLEFYTKAFGAETMARETTPRGGIHSMFRIGDSALMMGGPVPEDTPSALHLYVEKVEPVYEAALAAGATSSYPITQTEYGEYFGGIVDPAGIHWYIAERESSKIRTPEMGDVTPYLHPEGAPSS